MTSGAQRGAAAAVSGPQLPGTSVATGGRATASSDPWVVVVCLAQFMVVLDATIVNVALPSIQLGESKRVQVPPGIAARAVGSAQCATVAATSATGGQNSTSA